MKLKRIPVSAVRVGMHVHEFCGSWIDHPFWRPKFTLRSDVEVTRIRNSGIEELIIDLARGADVADEHAPASAWSPPPIQAAVAPVASPERRAGPPTEADLARATELFRSSTRQVKALFERLRTGQGLDPAGYTSLVGEIADSVSQNPGALVSVARLKSRDEYTYMHSVAVCALMVSLGMQLSLSPDDLRSAGFAGMLHDVGKALIPIEILNKNGRLSEAEFETIKTHPRRGHELLVEGTREAQAVLEVCLHHHEKIDGSGYPDGLRGDEIGRFAKMGAVCDVYDALTSNRPYKDAWDPAIAIRAMGQWSGHFDQDVYRAFVKTIGIYPVGSLVRLDSTRLAVVTAQTGSILKPRVKAFFSTKSDLRITPIEIDLSARAGRDAISGCEPRANWNFKDLDDLCGLRTPGGKSA